MSKMDTGEVQFGRRDFLKTTAMASVAAALPGTGIPAEGTGSTFKAAPRERTRKLLFLSDASAGGGKLMEPSKSLTAAQQRLIESIKSIKEYDFLVSAKQTDYQKPQEIIQSIQSENADILFMGMPRTGIAAGHLADSLGGLDIPVILVPTNFDLIMVEADLVAAFRIQGVPAMLAHSEALVPELVKIAASPRILEGKQALIFGRPFDSSSVPAHNLSEDYIRKRTGVRIRYRPIDELKQILESVDETSARKEMERWKREAFQVVEPSDKAILDASRLYSLLRSIVDREQLSAISIDCLSFSFGPNPALPYPCLAFTRLRDEGIAAPCEADVCGLLSSVFLEQISRKPSYFCNVSSVDTQKSTTVLRHCVAPLKLLGSDAAPLPYKLRDYHGMGRGVVPEVEYPAGVEVTIGGFSKDLKAFVVWPGRIQPGVNDKDRPSFPNMPQSKMRMFCSNRAEVKIRDAGQFLQSITGIHHVMVAGSYASEIRRAALRMNVTVIGPSDLTPPGMESL